jgi:hypothetical protein
MGKYLCVHTLAHTYPNTPTSQFWPKRGSTRLNRPVPSLFQQLLFLAEVTGLPLNAHQFYCRFSSFFMTAKSFVCVLTLQPKYASNVFSKHLKCVVMARFYVSFYWQKFPTHNLSWKAKEGLSPPLL